MSIQEFHILKELGAGSFGSVFQTLKKSDQQIYAMKQVKLSKLNAKQRQNALNQVRLLASIRTPYIISYKQAFFDQYLNTLCIVMEYANGGDLQKKIEINRRTNTKFDEEFIWKTAFHLLMGIKKLHQNKIMHRDIKAANIFFVNNIAKLGDMNVSRVIQQQGFARTQTGTPYYTSPQIWNNEPYGPKCDIWSIGCVIYETASLLPPFRAIDFPGLYKKVKNGVYDKIPSIYSNRLSGFIQRCLQTNPKKRASADQLLKISIFDKYYEEIQSEQQILQDQIDLIQTIRVPKILKQLNSKLPASHYINKSKKKLTTEQVSFEEKDSKNNHENDAKSLRHIKSQKYIIPKDHGNIQKSHKDIYISRKPIQKVENFKPMQEMKLPKIQSGKNIQLIEPRRYRIF